jgi:ubiquinol-cytochrome c reductase iron-sulfur subunit
MSSDDNWDCGYCCPRHKSGFDFPGCIYKGVPEVTEFRIMSVGILADGTLMIGVSQQGAV